MPDASELSFRLARLASETETPAGLLHAALDLVGTEFDWEQGNIWRIDYDEAEMLCIASWNAADLQFPNFTSLCQKRRFHFGEGLPGRVWKEQSGVWWETLPEHGFPRFNIARMDGLISGAGVPVIIHKRVVGAMEFFSRHRRVEEMRVLDLMMTGAAQLGSYLERLRLEEGLTGARAEFELLAERAVDAIVTIDESSTIVFVNPAFTRVFGYTADEIRGRNLRELIPTRMRPMHDAGMKRYVETGVRNITWDGIVLPALHHSGLEFQVEIRFGEFRQSGRRLFTGYIRPVPR